MKTLQVVLLSYLISIFRIHNKFDIESVFEIRRAMKRSERFKDSKCNHDIKKSFSTMRFRFLSDTPERADADVRAICPSITHTCCSTHELKDLRRTVNSYTQIIQIYYGNIKLLYRDIAQFNTTKFLDNFRMLRNSPKGKCIPPDFMPDIELEILNMSINAEIMLSKYNQLFQNINQFHSGFLCSICNIREQSKYRVIDETTMELSIDITTCYGLYLQKQLHLDVTAHMLKMFKIAKTISCLYTEHKIDDQIIANLTNRLEKKQKKNQSCLNLDGSRIDILTDPTCVKTCQKGYYIQRHINTFDFLPISQIIRKIFLYFDKGQFMISEEENIQLSADFDNANSIHFFKRIFDIWPPVMNSVYTNGNYIRKISFQGVNLFDNYVMPSLESEYVNTKYFKDALGNADKLGWFWATGILLFMRFKI